MAGVESPPAKKQKSIVEGGYPLEIFKTGFDDKFKCNKCGKILNNPVQSYCGHRFCHFCIYQMIDCVGSRVTCETCTKEGVEEDYSMITKDQIFPDNAVRREMAKMQTVCPNEGCNWSGIFREFEEHYKKCEYRLEKCPDCHTPVKRIEFEEHKKKTCLAREVECEHCGQKTSLREKEEHLKICPKVAITCEACGMNEILREKLSEHIEVECASQLVRCPAGCDPVDRGHYKEHIGSNVVLHIEWLMSKIDLQLKNNRDRQEIITANLDAGTMDVGKEIPRLRQYIQALQLKVADINQQTETLMNRRSEQGTNSNTLKGLELKVSTFEGIVTTLYREIERCIKIIEGTETQRKKEMEKIEEFDRRLKTVERSVSLWDVCKTEYENRIKALENISYEGSLVWRIDNWTKVRQDAISQKVTSFYSPYFYTGRTGYKMCARLYPNGDGTGKGTHISVFFVVVRGQYDVLLAWPFSHRVTFMLLDQSCKEHIIDTFRPDPNSNSFKRPTTDMNIASGCPQFVPLQKLNDSDRAYVKNDTLFLQIMVEPSRN